MIKEEKEGMMIQRGLREFYLMEASEDAGGRTNERFDVLTKICPMFFYHTNPWCMPII